MVKKGTTVANRLNREKSTDIKYKNLINRTGPLNKKALKDIFTLALAYGYMKKAKVPIQSKGAFINSENFGKNLTSSINALAITKSDKGIHILAEDTSEIFDVSEQYANGGLDFLEREYVGNEDDFIEKLRINILKNNKDDRIIKKIESMDL